MTFDEALEDAVHTLTHLETENDIVTIGDFMAVIRAARARTEKQNSRNDYATGDANRQEVPVQRSCAKGTDQASTVFKATAEQVARTATDSRTDAGTTSAFDVSNQLTNLSTAAPADRVASEFSPLHPGENLGSAGVAACEHPHSRLKYMGCGPLISGGSSLPAKNCRWNYECLDCQRWLKFDRPVIEIGAKLTDVLPYLSKEVMPTEPGQCSSSLPTDDNPATPPAVSHDAAGELEEAMAWLKLWVTGDPHDTPSAWAITLLEHIAAQKLAYDRLLKCDTDKLKKLNNARRWLEWGEKHHESISLALRHLYAPETLRDMPMNKP